MSKLADRRLSARETRALLARERLETTRASGFTFQEAAPRRSYAPHTHTRHQLLYAIEGTATLEADAATYLLPPQRAGFIPAGVKHVTSLGNANVVCLFLDRRLVRVRSEQRRVSVIDVTPLLREMIQFAVRWPSARRARDPLANAYFRAFGLLLEEWLTKECAYRLPRGQSRVVKRAIELTIQHAGVIELPALCRAVGASQRTLRRHLQAETGLGFRELSSTARVLRAMELLAQAESSVTAVALAVGFDSPSAFAKRFTLVAGESPSAFRARSRPAAGLEARAAER